MNNDFLVPEKRCEFWVDENRKQLWKAEIEMIEFVECICQQNDLDYFLLGGSAIGAVRHKGFIPWDDDMDIAMRRNDFEKFILEAEKQLPNHLFIQYGRNDGGHVCGLLRLRNNITTGIIRGDEDKQCNNGAFVEIYPIDNIPDNTLLQKKQHFISHVLYHGLLADYYGPASKAQIVLMLIVKLLGKNRAYRIWQKECQRYNSLNTQYVDTVALPNYAREGIHRFKSEWIQGTTHTQFEYTTVRISNHNDHMLRMQYGDYMQLPPVEKRGMVHDRIVFYDAKKPYTDYVGSKDVKEFFYG